MTRILISGGKGQLAQAFAWHCQKANPIDDASLEVLLSQSALTPGYVSMGDCQVLRLGRHELDISSPSSIAQALDTYRPDVLINTAAYTAVDRAESEPDLAYLINGAAPGLLAKACAQTGTQLIHVSTDYVFDGKAKQPYAEQDPTTAVSVYGRSKLEGEQRVLETLPSAVILRTSWIFSQFGNNFLLTMLHLGQERSELNIVSDQLGGPTYAVHIAQVLLALVSRMQICDQPSLARQASIDGDKHRDIKENVEASHSISSNQDFPKESAARLSCAFAVSASKPAGIYHFAGEPIVSWYDFAQEIFEQAQQLGLIQNRPKLSPISTAQYPTAARRPAQSGLRQDRLNQLLGKDNIQRDWREGIEQSLLYLKSI